MGQAAEHRYNRGRVDRGAAVRGMPGDKIIRSQTPSAPGAQHVPNRVEHPTQRVDARLAPPRYRQQRLDALPLLVGKDTGVQ